MGIEVDLLGERMPWKARHAKDIACEDDQKARVSVDLGPANGDFEVVWILQVSRADE